MMMIMTMTVMVMVMVMVEFVSEACGLGVFYSGGAGLWGWCFGVVGVGVVSDGEGLP